MTDYSVTELNLSGPIVHGPIPAHVPANLVVGLIDLPNKELTELPKDIHLYKNLKKLSCSYNKLTTLPENLPVYLKGLHCNNNQLTTLPENLPASIEFLNCNNNQLTTLPENLPVSLKYLDCGNNPFTKEYDFKITIKTLPRYYLEKEEREKSRGYGMYNAVFK